MAQRGVDNRPAWMTADDAPKDVKKMEAGSADAFDVQKELDKKREQVDDGS
eukprot:CAMPEP_0119486084 /NCGR_PEP_ID=MMETSP1344-20130328/12583_1 /TAXON_ID=236787 /ORGANISM="Florenciella parvula, Strain CCMP2471" /LENGTH=50 /DNA_ID=CAMNT_0007520801 /DNA_START=25 /DNA_END=174 /DNA_ORIENTATION=-